MRQLILLIQSFQIIFISHLMREHLCVNPTGSEVDAGERHASSRRTPAVPGPLSSATYGSQRSTLGLRLISVPSCPCTTGHASPAGLRPTAVYVWAPKSPAQRTLAQGSCCLCGLGFGLTLVLGTVLVTPNKIRIDLWIFSRCLIIKSIS